MDSKTGLLSKKNVKNIFIVSVGNFLSLIVSVLTGFVVPKFLSVDSYGLVQTEFLYASYASVIYFGLFEGIILRYAGTKTDDLPYQKIAPLLRVAFFWSGAVAVIFLVLGLILLPDSIGWIFIFLSIDIFFTNANTQMNNFSIMSMDFGFSTIVTVCSSFVRGIGIVVLALLRHFSVLSDITFQMYLLIYFVFAPFVFVVYLIRYKALFFAKTEHFFATWKEIWETVKDGFPLLAGNFVVTLIFEADRQFVNSFYSLAIYAVYSFAYSALRLLRVFSSSFKSTLFPALKTHGQEDVLNNYHLLLSSLLVLLFIASFSYYPLLFIIEKWLPKYIDSLPIFRIAIVSFCFYSCVNIVNQNIYKMEYKNIKFLFISLAILCVSVGLIFLFYYLFGSTASICFASLLSTFIWFIWTGWPFFERNRKEIVYTLVYMMLFFCGYLGFYFVPWIWLDFSLTAVLFIVLTFAFEKKTVCLMFSIFRKKK